MRAYVSTFIVYKIQIYSVIVSNKKQAFHRLTIILINDFQ